MTDEIPAPAPETGYEAAWKELVGLLGGSIDGCAKAAERGSAEAAQDMEIWHNVHETVDMVADEHDVEGIWEI